MGIGGIVHYGGHLADFIFNIVFTEKLKRRCYLLFKIIYSKKAVKFLKKQDKPTQKRLLTTIGKLPLDGDIKKLQGTDGYRLRIGNFKVLFDVNGVIIDIIDIGNRGQIYKGV